MGHNLVIAAYRWLTPKLRTAWEVDYILTMRELAIARKPFQPVEVHFFLFLGILAPLFGESRIFGGVLAAMNWIDNCALKIPGIRLMAWQMIFFLRGPIKNKSFLLSQRQNRRP